MTKSNNANISSEKIVFRQKLARKLNTQISKLIKGDSLLSKITFLVIWHGSLPRGEGGDKYDIDYAVFINASGASELMRYSQEFSSIVGENLPDFIWRNDLHYDGMDMFEAHTHMDPKETEIPHIGVHFYQKIAINELLEKQSWRSNQGSSGSFYRELLIWKRFCFFMRHWVYEGVVVYDAEGIFEQLRSLEHRMPAWMRKCLYDAVKCGTLPYTKSEKPVCTVPDSKEKLLDMLAMLAYSNAKYPMGRKERYLSDVRSISNPMDQKLLEAVINGNLACAGKLLLT